MLAWFLFATAVFDNKLAIVSAISGSYPAVDVFLGLLINKETMTKQQIAGAILALTSAFLLALFL
jgi:uncharacterized membrane protein